ncbi:MAG: glycosyltransferase family 4 protein [Ilumatobacteraceae bacterium]
MRVLMLTWEFPPRSVGGVPAHVEGLGQALARAGNDVVLLTLSHPGAPADSNVDGIRVLRARADLPWLPDDELVARVASANHHLVQLSTRLGSWLPDVVHAHDWQVAWAADTLAVLFGAKLIATFHSTERGQHGGRVPPGQPSTIHAVESWLAHDADEVVTNSRFLVSEVIEGFELAAERTHLIPNGIDPTWWSEGDTDERSALVFTWGRVQYEKGFQVLARAMRLLRSRVPGVECIIGGRGSYLPELQSQIDLEGVNDLVHLPGFLSDDRLREIVHRAGCVVIPSLYEPFGIVALEALAGGAPLVVARTGGLAELIDGTGAGLLFEPGNAAELATCVQMVLTDRRLADDMRKHGADLLADRYSWTAIAGATASVYAGHPSMP